MRSVSTVEPLAAMARVSNSTFSTPAVKPRTVARMSSIPFTGSNGMLWYTQSSARWASAVSIWAGVPQASQNSRTTSIGSATTPPRVGQAWDRIRRVRERRAPFGRGYRPAGGGGPGLDGGVDRQRAWPG